MSEPPKKKPSLARPIALGAAILLFFILARVFGLGGRLGELRGWIESLGPWGPPAFMAIYVVAVIFAFPGSVITVLAGVLFGSVRGVVIVSIASTAGASLAFLISRHVAREAIARRFAANPKFRSLDRLAREHGVIIIAIARLIPLFPFNLLNYAFGLTQVPFGTYVLMSWLCMLPGTVLYVVGSDAVSTLVSGGRFPWALAGVLAVAVAVIAVLVRHARRRLTQKESGDDRP